MNPQIYVNIAIGLLLVGVIAFRIARERKIPIGSLWILPGIVLLIALASIVYQRVDSPLDVISMLLGLVAGTALGWYQGVHSTVRVDKAAKTAFVKTSPFGAFLFVAAIAFRFGARYFTGGLAAPDPSGRLSPEAALVSAIALMFAVGILFGLRLYVKRAYDDAPAPS
ncbi:MAG TPA: hypothetical protein VKT51_11850 [Candidatus Eremiobacteraceae bacterium]|nr:hypothetical protein [Candidatus Eremiobacteraceae bacterium]